LINKEQEAQRPYAPEFQAYLRAARGTTETIAPVTYRPLFVVASRVVSARSFMIQHLGGEVLHLADGGWTNQAVAPSP
jgi:hypothetical protein